MASSRDSQSDDAPIDWDALFDRDSITYQDEPMVNQHIRAKLCEQDALGVTPADTLRELLLNALQSLSKRQLNVICITRMAWQCHLIDIVTTELPKSTILGCIESETQKRIHLHLNAETILVDHWGGWNVCKLDQECSENLRRELAYLCRTGVTADLAAHLLNEERKRRRSGRTKRQDHSTRLLPVDVRNVRDRVEGVPVVSRNPYQKKRRALDSADYAYRGNTVSVRKRRKGRSDVANKENMTPCEGEHRSLVDDDAELQASDSAMDGRGPPHNDCLRRPSESHSAQQDKQEDDDQSAREPEMGRGRVGNLSDHSLDLLDVTIHGPDSFNGDDDMLMESRSSQGHSDTDRSIGQLFEPGYASSSAEPVEAAFQILAHADTPTFTSDNEEFQLLIPNQTHTGDQTDVNTSDVKLGQRQEFSEDMAIPTNIATERKQSLLPLNQKRSQLEQSNAQLSQSLHTAKEELAKQRNELVMLQATTLDFERKIRAHLGITENTTSQVKAIQVYEETMEVALNELRESCKRNEECAKDCEAECLQLSSEVDRLTEEDGSGKAALRQVNGEMQSHISETKRLLRAEESSFKETMMKRQEAYCQGITNLVEQFDCFC